MTNTEPRTAPRSNNEFLTHAYLYSLTAVVDRLRSTADRIERDGSRVTKRDGTPNHLGAYGDVVAEIQSLMGNLHLSNLLDNARTADAHWETTP